jgi:hypothetical protein
MKNLTKTIAIAAITALSFVSFANNGNENDANLAKKSKSFAVGMYQPVNTMKMNLLVKNDGGQRIHIILKNLNEDILYSENLSKNAGNYSRKFDFIDMENGKYIFEISNGKSTEVKTVNVESKKIETAKSISFN